MFTLGRHSYDEATLRWALEKDTWHRLPGPVAHTGQGRRKALLWLEARPKADTPTTSPSKGS